MQPFKIMPLSPKFREPLVIGRQSEDGAAKIEFDCTELVRVYGSGTAGLYAKRPDEVEPYIVTGLEKDGNIIRWTVSAYDTARVGMGALEVCWFSDDETISARPVDFDTVILEGVGVATATAEASQILIDEVARRYNQIVALVETAGIDAENAEKSATAAAASATAAATSEANAKVSADAAAKSATAAATSATNAATSATKAAASEKATYDLWHETEIIEETTSNYTTDAKAAADAAAKSAETAAENVTKALQEAKDSGEFTGATPDITMSAAVDQTVGTPAVSVTKTGTAENPAFSLAFSGIKGETGDCNLVAFEVENGELYANYTIDDSELSFSLTDGNLEVEING